MVNGIGDQAGYCRWQQGPTEVELYVENRDNGRKQLLHAEKARTQYAHNHPVSDSALNYPGC